MRGGLPRPFLPIQMTSPGTPYARGYPLHPRCRGKRRLENPVSPGVYQLKTTTQPHEHSQNPKYCLFAIKGSPRVRGGIPEKTPMLDSSDQ